MQSPWRWHCQSWSYCLCWTVSQRVLQDLLIHWKTKWKKKANENQTKLAEGAAGMMRGNHIYSKFLIRNCWHGEKFFFLESVACFSLWVRMNLVGFDIFSAFVSKFSPPEAAARLQPLSPASVGILLPLWFMLFFSVEHRRAHLAAEMLPAPVTSGSPCAAAGDPGQCHPARAQWDNCCCCFLVEVHGREQPAGQPTEQPCLSSSWAQLLPWRLPKPILTPWQSPRS